MVYGQPDYQDDRLSDEEPVGMAVGPFAGDDEEGGVCRKD